MNGSGLGSPERSRGWLESRYLFPWLTVATKGLSIGSKNRVREEIWAHFDDAVDTYVAEGLPDEIAAERAIDNLGSAKAAGRAFRRSYLTWWEEVNIRPFLLSRFPLPIALAFLAASLGMFAAAALEPTKGTTLWWVRFFSASGCTLTWIAYLVMFDWTRGRERGRRDARLGALATVAYWFLYTGVTMVDQPRVAVVFVPLLAVMIVTYFKAIPKLAEVSRSEAPTGTGRQLDGDDPV